MPFSRQSAAKFLNDLLIDGSIPSLGSTFFIAILRADPGEDDSAFDEPLEDSGYARVQADAGDWNTPAVASGVVQSTNVNLLNFGTAATDIGNVSHFAVMNRDAADYAVAALTTGIAGAGAFKVAGNITAQLVVGELILIRDSTGNDGVYHIRSGSSYSAPNTTINVEEAVSDATVDGTVWLLGAIIDKGTLDTTKDIGTGDTIKMNAGDVKVGAKTVF
ncbi:MAG: hypothetical protein GC162_10380 [Planctomycetes bacterium]|nr:hypothetical protein [Planctomycetota bacterium]